nr:uncharacterized protein LOC113700766 [Coffea arabica]
MGSSPNERLQRSLDMKNILLGITTYYLVKECKMACFTYSLKRMQWSWQTAFLDGNAQEEAHVDHDKDSYDGEDKNPKCEADGAISRDETTTANNEGETNGTPINCARGKHASVARKTRRNSKKICHSKKISKRKSDHLVEDDESSGEEKFHDSDYDFSDEDEFYRTFSKRENDWVKIADQFRVNKSNLEAGHEKYNGIEETSFDSVEETDSSTDKEFDSNSSSSDNEGGICSKSRKYERFNPKTDMDDPKFKLKLVFTDKQLFKKACRAHGVKWGRKIRFKKDDLIRVRAYCKGKGCNWFAYASKLDKTGDFIIKTMMTTHTCGRTSDHGMANIKFLCDKYLEDFRLNPNYKPGDFVNKVHTDVNATITRNVAYRTKAKAKELIEGKRGFLDGCRPVVGLDGCHLRGPHKGVLLTALGIDPNNQLFPVMYVVVEIENKHTWRWFLTELKHDLHITNERKWTFMIDKQKGLIQAIHELLPGVEHRMCVRHMYNNFKKEHPGLALKDRIWSAARASYESRFASEMESLKEFDVEAFNWLVKHTTPKEWTRSHFRILSKCDILLNNLCESFNSIILDAREQPIIAGVWKYEVRCMYRDRYTVDLASRTCSCRKWDLSGIPCSHAYSAITLTDEEPKTFVHDCYSKEAYMRAYSPVIGPMDGEELWPKANKGPLLPPEKIKLPGRLSKKEGAR